MRFAILTSVTFFVLCSGVLSLFSFENGLDILKLVPDLSEEIGWTWAEGPVLYEPDDLFEYVNGGAPQYLSYGFTGLVHARCSYEGEDLRSVTVDIFDMGSCLGAYGIYSSGRPRGIAKRSWGVEGYRSGTVAAAWKGRIYLRGAADEDTPALIGKLEALMEEVITTVPGDSNSPPELSVLPVRGLIAGSDKYIGKNLLGHSFLPGGFLANYEVEGNEVLLFVSDLGDWKKAGEAFELFFSFENTHGRILRKGKIGEESFWSEDPGLGVGVVFRRESYVGGLWGFKDAESRIGLVEALDNKLASGVLKE